VLKSLIIFHAQIEYNEFLKHNEFSTIRCVFLNGRSATAFRCTLFSGEKILDHFLVDLTPYF